MLTADALYLTEADVHGDARANWKRQAPLSAAELRAYVVYHALFSGPLVVGDSQILNNPALRAVVGESGAADGTFRADLLELIDSGVLQVAVRSSAESLVEVAKQHHADKVETTGDWTYIDAVSEAASRNPLEYSFADVGESFTSLVREYVRDVPADQVRLENKERLGFFIKTRTLDASPLKFNDLKRWVTKAFDDHVLSQQERDTILRQVARIYRYGLPTALDVGTDFPSNRGAATRILRLEESERRSAGVAYVRRYVVGFEFLTQIPANAVNDIVNQSAANAYFSAAAHTSSENGDADTFATALEEYEELINEVRVEYALAVDDAAAKQRTQIDIIVTDGALALAGFAMKDLAPELLYGDPPVVLEALRTGAELVRRPGAEV